MEASDIIPSSQAKQSSEILFSQAEPSQNEPSSQLGLSQVKPSSVAQALPTSSTVSTVLPGPSSQAKPSTVSSNSTNGPALKKQRIDYSSMSTSVYLDSTVVPILHVALVTLDRIRPADPVQHLVNFLIQNKDEFSKSTEQPSSSANQK